VNAAHAAADLLQGGDGFAGAVQDHVRGIEIDEQIVARHVPDETQQPVRGFLTGFQVQILAVGRRVIADLARYRQHVAIQGIGRIVGDEAQVQSDDVAAQQAGKVGDLLHLLCAGGPRFRRNQPDRTDDRGDVRVTFAFETSEHDADLDAQFLQSGDEFLRVFRAPRFAVGGVQMDRRNTQLVGHLESHSQPCVNTGKHTNRPLFHDLYSCR